MKSQKGVTLISLLIYIIGMLIVVSALIVITVSLRNNVSKLDESNKFVNELSKLNMYLLEETKSGDNSIKTVR